MVIRKLDDIVVAAKAKGRKRLIVAYGQDAHTIEAVHNAIQAGLVEATLIGDPDEIAKVCTTLGFDQNLFKVVPETNDVKCVQRAVQLITQGQGDVLMKGLVSTDKYMRGILNKDAGLVPPKGVLSHVAVVELPGYPRLLTIADVAVIPYPDFKQKTVILSNLIKTAHTLGIECPKVACISASEQLLPSVISSTEAAMLAKMGDRGQCGKAIVDGPLSLDVALYKEGAEQKTGKGSAAAGGAGRLLFPNIDAANVFFKSASKLAGAELAAMVTGTAVPCVLTSRGDSSKTKLYSIALACLSAK